jgi:ChaB
MPRSWRYSMTELPGTLQRSCREAQETFLSALADAVRIHGAGDQAHRIAYQALKQKFEKRGDHWIAKDNPADWGGAGKLISLPSARRAAASSPSRSSAWSRWRSTVAPPRAPRGDRRVAGGRGPVEGRTGPGPHPRRSRPGRCGWNRARSPARASQSSAGSFTKARKKSSTCRIASVNRSRLTGLVMYALACNWQLAAMSVSAWARR